MTGGEKMDPQRILKFQQRESTRTVQVQYTVDGHSYNRKCNDSGVKSTYGCQNCIMSRSRQHTIDASGELAPTIAA
jgi:hypothetical protein